MEHKKALAALLSAVLVLLACVSCGPSEQTKETLAEHDGHIYSEVADHLDRQEDIYLQLSQKTAELAEDPGDVSRIQWLDGYLCALCSMTQNSKLTGTYRIYLDGDQELVDMVRSVLSTNCVYVTKKDVFTDRSPADLEDISQLYRQLSGCFDRNDETSFASHIDGLQLEDDSFQTARQQLEDLLLELDLALDRGKP